MKKYVACLVALFFVFATLKTSAQDNTQHFHSRGALFGFGQKFNMDALYNPVFFQGAFSWQFDRKKRKNFLAFYLEPQFNLVNTERRMDIEFGTNVGLRYYQQVFSDLYFYETLSSGPHYITANLERQAKGFIFSDNLAVGLFKKLFPDRSLYLNLQAGVRHISNAGLKTPNWGVNTMNFMVGFSNVGL